MTAAILWLVPLALGVLFGWAWGRASGFKAGWSACRQHCLKLAQSHDLAMIGLQIERAEEPR